MKTLKILSLAALAAFLFSTCKKNDSSSAPTLQKLQGKWTFEKEYYHENYGGVDYRDTAYNMPGDYVDFRTDNLVYSKYDNYYDTASYYLLNDNKLVVKSLASTDTISIINLTANSMQLYAKQFDPAPDYYEFTDFFVK